MEISQIALWILGISSGVLGWFARELYNELNADIL